MTGASAWMIILSGSSSVSLVKLDHANVNSSNISAASSADAGYNNTVGTKAWLFPNTWLTWNAGDSTTTWADPRNWDLGYVPNSTDSVTIPAAGGINPVPPLSLQLQDMNITTGTLASASGTTVTLTGNLTAGTSASMGSSSVNTTFVMKTNLATIDSQIYLGHLTIDPSALNSVKIANHALALDGNLSVSTGSFDLNGQGLTLNNAANVKGNVTASSAGSFTASGLLTLTGDFSVTTSGGAASLASATGGHVLTISSSGGKISASGALGSPTALTSVSLTARTPQPTPSRWRRLLQAHSRNTTARRRSAAI